jgi:hypothetical protein
VIWTQQAARNQLPLKAAILPLMQMFFIAAIGHGPNPLLFSELPELKRGKRGNVIVDEEFRTSM